MKQVALSIALSVGATGAFAEPITAKDARGALYPSDAAQVIVINHSFLSDTDQSLLAQIAQEQSYYGAIAFGPDDGLMSESLVGAFNYHDLPSARGAALAGCEAQRKGQAACAVVALVQPKAWREGQPISLSGEATAAFEQDYRRARSPKALAISPSTGKFAVATDPAAPGTAMAQCAALAQTQDCTVVLSE